MKKYVLFLLTIIFALMLPASLVYAATSISKGYQTKSTDLKIGMAVSLGEDSTNDNQYVEASSVKNKQKYIGIVTTVDDSTVTISSGNSTIYVSNSGQHTVFVSDLNGEVKKDDLLTVSPIEGVLMKMNDSDSGNNSVAVALDDLSSSGSKSSKEIKLSDGTPRSIQIGQVAAEVNTVAVNNENSNKLLNAVGESLTGHKVSEVRIIIACTILFVILIIVGAIVYGAVSSSILAIGRNPLSKKSVYRQLGQASVLAISILLFGAIGIYVVIWT